MKIREKVSNFLKSGESAEINSIENLPDEYRQLRKDKLQKVRERKKEFQRRTSEAVEELGKEISELEEFSDPKDRAVVEDVISNIEKDRKSLVENFQPSDKPEELIKDLENFLEEFRSMTRKEAAVMKEAGFENSFSEQIGKIENLIEEIEEFTEAEFQTAKNLEELKEEQNSYLESGKKISEIKSKIQETKIDEKREKLEEVKESLKELEESSSREDYKGKKRKKEDLTEKIDSKTRKISSSVGKMQRGLKKMIYKGEIGKVSGEASDALREIRDGKDEKIISRKPEVIEEASEAAIESAEDSDISDSTRKKLVEGAENLNKFGEIKKEVKNLKERREKIQDELDSHDYLEERAELQKKIERLEGEIGELEEERNSLENEKEELEYKRKNIEENIKEILDEEFESISLGEDFWKKF